MSVSIDIQTARELINKYLSAMEDRMNSFGSALPNHAKRPYIHLVVARVTEYDFGWVFFYTSKEYLETRDISYLLAGNAPLIVDKNDSRLYVTGTARPIEYYIGEYRQGNKTLA